MVVVGTGAGGAAGEGVIVDAAKIMMDVECADGGGGGGGGDEGGDQAFPHQQQGSASGAVAATTVTVTTTAAAVGHVDREGTNLQHLLLEAIANGSVRCEISMQTLLR
jgi:hypothetical protein